MGCYIASVFAARKPIQVTFQYGPNFIHELCSLKTTVVAWDFQRSSSLLRNILWMSSHQNREPFLNWNNKLEILGPCFSSLLTERSAVCVFEVPELCAKFWRLCSDIAKFFGARAKLSHWPSLTEL
jgi:hypothetical protein